MEGSVPLRAYQSHHEIYNKLLLSTKYPENSQTNCCFNQNNNSGLPGDNNYIAPPKTYNRVKYLSGDVSDKLK